MRKPAKHRPARRIASVKNAATQLNDFSLRVIKEVIQKGKKGENIVIAPIGIAACTATLANGAKGKTQDELLEALSLKKNAFGS